MVSETMAEKEKDQPTNSRIVRVVKGNSEVREKSETEKYN